jgi:hypothetical protein
MKVLLYSWITKKSSMGLSHMRNHILNKETMISLCGQFKPNADIQQRLIFRKMSEVFQSTRCGSCLYKASIMGIKLDTL